MDGLLPQIEEIIPYDAGTVMLVEGSWARAVRRRGYEQFGPGVLEGMNVADFELASLPNLAQMVSTRQPMVIADTAEDSNWKPVAVTPYVRAWIGAPVVAQGEVLACFCLDKREPSFYGPEHARRLMAYAGQVALALQNARLYAAQRRRSEEQRLLLLAARDLSAGLSQAAVLGAIARHMTDGLHNDGCTIYSWDRANDCLVTLLDYSRNANDPLDAVGNTHALSGYPVTRRVLEQRQPAVVSVDEPGADAAEVEVMRGYQLAHMAMLPLYTGEEVFGLVEVVRNYGRPAFTEPDVQLVQSLAAHAAVALENSRLHTAVQENLRELNALLTANEALLSTLELEPLLQNILSAAIQAVPSAQKGTVILADEDREELQIRAVHGYADPRILGLKFGYGLGFAGRTLRENRPQLIVDTAREPSQMPEPQVTEMATVRSAIVAPLVPKDASAPAYGVISLDATVVGAFSAADLRVLVAFANTAAVAIDNARLHAEVQRLAVTDSATGLANPRAFEHALQTEFHRAQRYGYALSLVIMDIDSFKQYNDTYGHPAGNERLRGIADVLRATLRDPDLPVRYGGEEFALLLPHTSKGGALALAERIRVAAEAAAPAGLPRGGPLPGYSLSVGVASFPSDARSADDLLVAADNAELVAKRGGKNRVIAAPPLPGAPPPQD
jgi:diguanylate cyclase (GGDEF)-like protein